MQCVQAVESWFSREMMSAPAELSGGFFVSHLGFYDVQDSLANDTLLAVAVAMSVAVVILLAREDYLCLFGTLDPLLYALHTVQILLLSNCCTSPLKPASLFAAPSTSC